MNRTTRKMLENRLAELKKLTGEDYELSIYSPGDGWTRYQLISQNGRTDSSVLTIREMFYALDTACQVLFRMKYRAQQPKPQMEQEMSR